MDRNGTVAHEFYIVSDVNDGEIQKIEGGIRKVTDAI